MMSGMEACTSVVAVLHNPASVDNLLSGVQVSHNGNELQSICGIDQPHAFFHKIHKSLFIF